MDDDSHKDHKYSHGSDIITSYHYILHIFGHYHDNLNEHKTIYFFDCGVFFCHMKIYGLNYTTLYANSGE